MPQSNEDWVSSGPRDDRESLGCWGVLSKCMFLRRTMSRKSMSEMLLLVLLVVYVSALFRCRQPVWRTIDAAPILRGVCWVRLPDVSLV
jgi:hypothetical protein